MNFFRQDRKADLHIHTTFSDGACSPEDVVEMAVRAGISIISITDHDSVEGIGPAKEAAGSKGISVIHGVEFSAMMEDIEVHILGYGFDPAHPALLQHIDYFRRERYNRAEKILDKLSSAGFTITMDQLVDHAGHTAIGRPHIADVMVQNGYAVSSGDVFRDYIGRNGIAFEDKAAVSPAKIIDIIKSAGGAAVLAHPGSCIKEKYIMELVRDGLDGFETVHPFVTPENAAYCRRIAKQYRLIETGGSDFHGRSGQHDFGKFVIPEDWVDNIKSRAVFNKLMR